MNERADDMQPAATAETSKGGRHLDEAGINLKPSARRPARAVVPVATDLRTIGQVTVQDPVFACRDVNVFYGDKHAIKNVNIDIARGQVLAMIGPSGCGKSTFLRCLNRMNDTIPGARVTGSIQLDGKDIHDRRQDVLYGDRKSVV